MVYVMSISLLLCLVVIIPSLPCQKASKPFWRRRNNQTKPTLLPSIKKDPEFYRSKLIFSHFNTIYPAVSIFEMGKNHAQMMVCRVKMTYFPNQNLFSLRESLIFGTASLQT